jgi:ribosomal protein S13
MSKNRTPGIVDEIADQIIEDLSLNERVTIANLEDDQVEFINQLLAEYIQSKLKQWAAKYGEPDTWEAEAIIKEIWNRLRESHRLRIVKKGL